MPEYVEKEALLKTLCDADGITAKGIAILKRFPATKPVTVSDVEMILKSVVARSQKRSHFVYRCPHCGTKMNLEG